MIVLMFGYVYIGGMPSQKNTHTVAIQSLNLLISLALAYTTLVSGVCPEYFSAFGLTVSKKKVETMSAFNTLLDSWQAALVEI